MNAQHITRASKELSWLLRHGAAERSLTMDAAGWTAIADVLRVLGITRAQLDTVVAENTKSRLQVDGARIRACQGHSVAGMPVTHEALEASWAPWTDEDSLWHGTHTDALASIAREGLLAQGRTHVHLAATTGSKVGKRAGVGVLLEVSPARLRAHGLGVFVSPNGVVLTRAVPPDCIVGVMAVSANARAREAELRAMFVCG